jgi:hypothetical protein
MIFSSYYLSCRTQRIPSEVENILGRTHTYAQWVADHASALGQ